MKSLDTISVIIPTWKRPDKLKLCLEHMENQIRRPDQLIIVLRNEDNEAVKIAEQFCSRFSNWEMVFASKAGVVAAENFGLAKVKSKYVAFIDDDGYAPPTWLKQIADFFQKYPDAGAVGGSDMIKSEPWTYHDYETNEVGLITWYGKIIGNHHRKCIGEIRETQVLKGVNMCFRRDSFDFLDEKLSGVNGKLGNGSQWELDICFTAISRKFKIYFDPTLVVIHDSDHSKHVKNIAIKNNAHNMSYVMKKHLSSIKFFIFLIYALFVGSEQLPGLLKLIFDLIKKRDLSLVISYQYKFIGFIKGITT